MTTKTRTKATIIGIQDQPVNAVEWVPRGVLHSNDYNPNHVAPPELRLLKISIIEDGWTQPIVAKRDGTIVDGFHRWTLSADPDVAAMTDGLVPVVFLPDSLDPAHQRMSTIRHNRARGQHGVLKMADIVNDLAHELGMTPQDISRRLQMDDEEVDRLLDRGNMRKRGRGEAFNAGWVPS